MSTNPKIAPIHDQYAHDLLMDSYALLRLTRSMADKTAINMHSVNLAIKMLEEVRRITERRN